MPSGAGLNRVGLFGGIEIARVGPWSSVGDDFGPVLIASGWSKVKFTMIGPGSGYEVTFYGSDDPAVFDAVFGVYKPEFGTRAMSPQNLPTGGVPVANQAWMAAIPETSYYVMVGPSEQSGSGSISNPLVSNGTNAVVFETRMSTRFVRAKVTAIQPGASEINQILAEGIP